jgi:hypothetical protein
VRSLPPSLTRRTRKDIEMRGKAHRHVALVNDEGADTAGPAHVHAHASAEPAAANGFSLLRLSVPARLLIVAVASALLWAAVLWALV